MDSDEEIYDAEIIDLDEDKENYDIFSDSTNISTNNINNTPKKAIVKIVPSGSLEKIDTQYVYDDDEIWIDSYSADTCTSTDFSGTESTDEIWE